MTKAMMAMARGDEDGDGARTDEEIDELDERGDDVQGGLEQEVDDGQAELDDDG